MADKFKLELKSAERVVRMPAPGAVGALGSAKFLDALFGNEAVVNKRNTEALEIAPNTMVSGRVVTHVAAHQLPLADVKAKVRERVVAMQAAAMARKLGEARLAELKAAPATAMSEPPLTVSRAQVRDLTQPVLDAVLKAPTATLPAFVRRRPGRSGLRGGEDHPGLGPRPCDGRCDSSKESVRAGVGRGGGAGVLRSAQDAVQGRIEAEGARNFRCRLCGAGTTTR